MILKQRILCQFLTYVLELVDELDVAKVLLWETEYCESMQQLDFGLADLVMW